MFDVFISVNFIELVVLLSNGLVFKSPYLSDKEKSDYGYLVIAFICVILCIAVARLLLDYVFPLLQGRKSRSSLKRQLQKLERNAETEGAGIVLLESARVHVPSIAATTTTNVPERSSLI